MSKTFANLICLLILWKSTRGLAAIDLGYEDDTDLTNFVTRPEIKMPLFDVRIHLPYSVSPGLWFVAPYAQKRQEPFPQHYYQPCQTGPAIYDPNGNLVWSGACEMRNQNAADFRAHRRDNRDFLSTILYSYQTDRSAAGVVLDDTYRRTNTINAPTVVDAFDIHELNIIEQGEGALFINHTYRDLASSIFTGRLKDTGFQHLELATGKVKFSWWAYEHISLRESSVNENLSKGAFADEWDHYHLNSVDISIDGDYLVSARNTNCIYLISHRDGSILWRLGGKNSTFILHGFNFSRQHDARFVSQSSSTTVISFLDNASDGVDASASYSSAMLVELETSTTLKTARLLQKWDRPDRKLTLQRGNVQVLSNSNVFVCWSDNSYISEHDMDGRTIFEAQFRSERFATYRGYKFNFTSSPRELPTLKSFAFGATRQTSTTVIYVSWNGATDVAYWKFFAYNQTTNVTLALGTIEKRGFETTFQKDGFYAYVLAEAVDVGGKSLGMTIPEKTRLAEDAISGDSRSSSQENDLLQGERLPKTKADVSVFEQMMFPVGVVAAGFTLLLAALCAIRFRTGRDASYESVRQSD